MCKAVFLVMQGNHKINLPTFRTQRIKNMKKKTKHILEIVKYLLIRVIVRGYACGLK